MRSARSFRRRLTGSAGASAVEYSLGLGLLVVAILFGVQSLQDGASDEFADRSDGISAPGDVGGVPTTLPGGTTTTSSSTSSTSSTVPVSTSSSSTSTTTGSAIMGGPNCMSGDCQFTVSGAPSGSSFTWEVLEGNKLANGSASPVQSTATAASFTTRFTKAGTYVVQVVVGASNQGLSKTVEVTCIGNGVNEVCTAT